MAGSTLLHEIVIAVIIGGLTGRLVDFMAVQLLFRPYQPRRLGPWSLHGVLPARQDALARQVANNIADRLLSAETLAAFISSPELAEKIRANVSEEVDRFLDRELPAVRDLLGDLMQDGSELDEEIRVLAAGFGEFLAGLAQRPEVRERTALALNALVKERRGMRVDELLSPGILEAVRRFVEGRLEALAARPEAAATALEQWFSGLGAPGDLLSPSAREALRLQARENLPAWLKALEEALRRPDTQAWLDRYVLDAVEGFIEDLPRQGFLGELVGWFIRSTYRENKAFYRRKLLEILPGQVASFREGLSDSANRERMNRKLDQLFEDLFGTSLGDRYRSIPERWSQDLKGVVAEFLASEATISSLRHGFEQLFARFRGATLEEFLPGGLRLESAEAAEAAPTGLVREAVDFGYDILLESGLQQQLATMLTRGALYVMSRPIGRLQDRLGPERIARIHDTLERQVLAAAEREAPRLASLIDVRSLVEAKVRHASSPAIERMVKNLARKELNSIFTKGLYGGVAVGLVLTGVLLGLERALDAWHPGAGLAGIAVFGLGLLITAARRLRIPDSPES